MSNIEYQLQQVTKLISLPEIYLKVRQLMDDTTSDIYDFAEVISVDPNLSTRVLTVVNSTYFGFPKPIDCIARAVNMIGIGQLLNMVLDISAPSGRDLAPAQAQNQATERLQTADSLIDAEVLAVIGLTQQELDNSLDKARALSAEMEEVILV